MSLRIDSGPSADAFAHARLADTLDYYVPDHLTEYDGLAGWTDEDGRFFARGGDDVVREYGDGENETARLQADLSRTPAPTGRTSAMKPVASPFWSGLVVAMRNQQERVEVACVVLALLLLTMIAGRVLLAWLGGAL